jgi:hypothetical protein
MSVSVTTMLLIMPSVDDLACATQREQRPRARLSASARRYNRSAVLSSLPKRGNRRSACQKRATRSSYFKGIDGRAHWHYLLIDKICCLCHRREHRQAQGIRKRFTGLHKPCRWQ